MDKSGLKFFKSVHGVEVFIDPVSGAFHAEVGGRSIKRRAYADIERLASQSKRPVEAIVVTSGYGDASFSRPRKVKLVSVVGDDDKFRTEDGGTFGGWREHVYLYDEGVFNALTDIYDRAELLVAERERATSGLRAITQKNFESLREGPESADGADRADGVEGVEVADG